MMMIMMVKIIMVTIMMMMRKKKSILIMLMMMTMLMTPIINMIVYFISALVPIVPLIVFNCFGSVSTDCILFWDRNIAACSGTHRLFALASALLCSADEASVCQLETRCRQTWNERGVKLRASAHGISNRKHTLNRH